MSLVKDESIPSHHSLSMNQPYQMDSHQDCAQVESGLPRSSGLDERAVDLMNRSHASPNSEQPFNTATSIQSLGQRHGTTNLNGHEMPNIEATPVEDDPREWSARRKLVILGIISLATLAPTTGAFIYQPAIEDVQGDLHATTNEIALSLSLFILVQGSGPLIWSSISEIKGRRFVYIVAMVIFIIGSAIGGCSRNITTLICMRMLQAVGSAAMLAIGAGTLADIYATHERGTMMGIFYAAPLVGQSLGPLFGGVLTHIWNWRATFYFLTIIGGIVLISLLMFKETFRRERSLTYQAAKRHAIRRLEKKQARQDKDAGSCIETGVKPTSVGLETAKVTLTDLNPFKPIWNILRRKNNLAIIFTSALLFALQYSICFTAARTLAALPYQYDPLHVGLVLLSFGLGISVATLP
ncbi:MFS general substrate transporter [Serendipita vermifera]|nr:MFS general substrate transporter [Serendipita vermifera]